MQGVSAVFPIAILPPPGGIISARSVPCEIRRGGGDQRHWPALFALHNQARHYSFTWNFHIVSNSAKSGTQVAAEVNLTEIGAMAHYHLRYRSRRVEVWNWYWKQWLTRYWFIHALLAAFAVFIIDRSLSLAVNIENQVVVFIASQGIVTAFFAAWPQIRFKSHERILEIGPEGWATHIGLLSGRRSWAEVASVDETENGVSIVGVNGNALIIPRRALAPSGEWERFLADVRKWHSLNNP